MKPGGSRQKGHNFERQIAQRCRVFFPEARRGLQGRGGGDAPDVDGVDAFWIETKAGRPAKKPEDALAQAERDCMAANDNRHAIAICKEDRREPRVYMRLRTVCPTGPDGGVVISMSFDDWLNLARRF